MTRDSRMTVRLDPATRRKVERLAANENSLNEALNRLLQQAATRANARHVGGATVCEPRKVGFGFDIAKAGRLAAEMSDEHVLQKLERRR